MRPRHALRAALAGLLGAAVAVAVSCGSSSGKLIPVANAGPLQSDFEAIVQAAQTGGGSCGPTEAAILKTEQNFAALPGTVDAGLRNTLRQGIENLRTRALALCTQPLAQTTAASTTPKTTTATAPTTTTTTTPTTTTPTTTIPTTTPTTASPGGGTPAPGSSETPAGAGGQGGGTKVGEGTGAGSGGGAGGALPGQEAPK
jgi:hypothetical protein